MIGNNVKFLAIKKTKINVENIKKYRDKLPPNIEPLLIKSLVLTIQFAISITIWRTFFKDLIS